MRPRVKYNLEGRIVKVGNLRVFVERREHLDFYQDNDGILSHEVVILERLKTCTDETRRAFLSQSKVLVLKVSYLATFIGKQVQPGRLLIGTKLGARLVTLDIDIRWRNCSKLSEHFFKAVSKTSTLRNLAVTAYKNGQLRFRSINTMKRFGLRSMLSSRSITDRELDATYYEISKFLMQSEQLMDVWLNFQIHLKKARGKFLTKILLASLEKKPVKCHAISPYFTGSRNTAGSLPLDFWEEVLELQERALYYRSLTFDTFLSFR